MSNHVVDPRPAVADIVESILERRAARLGVARKDVPLINSLREFVPSAEELEQQLGMTLEEILEQDKARMLISIYPTPDCLSAEEVQSYINDPASIPTEQRQHIVVCSMCGDVLRIAANPPTPRFLQELQK